MIIILILGNESKAESAKAQAESVYVSKSNISRTDENRWFSWDVQEIHGSFTEKVWNDSVNDIFYISF